MINKQKITPFLWFNNQAEEAVNFYTSIFSDSEIKKVDRNGDAVMTILFSLNGQDFIALNGGPMFTFNESISFVINCKGQEEVDYFWQKLTADGGEESMCSWLKDKYGVSWQVVPEELRQLMADPDPARAQRAIGAMMQMRKIDIEKLRQAADDESKTVVTIQTTVLAPIDKVWQMWTKPEHIVHWNNASDDWHSPNAENDLRSGGTFNYRMEAKDGSAGFDFKGKYTMVAEKKCIEYSLEDGRNVQVHFSEVDGGTFVMENFEAENTHPIEMQKGGWQAILDNFKKYVENN